MDHPHQLQHLWHHQHQSHHLWHHQHQSHHLQHHPCSSAKPIPQVDGCQCLLSFRPTQPYPIGYPPAPWPQYPPYYAAPQGSLDSGSEMAKPDKFTGWELSKLCPFIISCIMAFDSRPHKFATNCQQVSFTVSYLSDIAMLLWQPTLVAYPELSIWGDWGEFVDQLNVYFRQPNLAQASKCA